MRAFQAFTYSRLTPWLITPCLTLARASQPDNLHFPPCGWRVSPIQAASFPSPVRWRRGPPSHLTLSFHLHLSDSESWSPVGRRRGAPGQTTLPFQASCSVRLTRLKQRVLSSRQTSARASQPDKLTFSILWPARPTQSRCQLTAGRPLNFTLLSKPVRLGEPRSPDRRRREHSRPDNLTFSSPTLGEAYPSDTESLDLPSDVGESLPARQTHLFRPLVPQYRTPIECYISDWSSNLSFQSTTGEA